MILLAQDAADCSVERTRQMKKSKGIAVNVYAVELAASIELELALELELELEPELSST